VKYDDWAPLALLVVILGLSLALAVGMLIPIGGRVVHDALLLGYRP
jgi:hypothetical protein